MNFYTPTLAELPGGENSVTTVIVLGVLIAVMQAAVLAKSLFGKKEGVELKQPVAIEGGGEPLRTINEPKFSEKFASRREHEGLAAAMKHLEQTLNARTESLHREITETAEKSEQRTAATHDRLNVIVEKLGELNGMIKATRKTS